MNDKHTPTPWRTSARASLTIFGADRSQINIASFAPDEIGGWTQSETRATHDAEFIVRACNRAPTFDILREVVEYGFGELDGFKKDARESLGLDVLYEKLAAAYNVLVTHDEEEANQQRESA